MIPVLHMENAIEYTSNGIGRLSDATKCVVTEERNGMYELEMEYPMTGAHFDDLMEGRIICATPADGKPVQPFVIYKITRPINGIVKISAEHISYMLSKIPVMPFTANSCIGALQKIHDNAAIPCPFDFWTDKSVNATMTVDTPTSARALLGGSEGSVLDTYGTGEYEWDGFTVKLHLHRGSDKGVTLKYGKNITDLTRETDTSGVYTCIVPYWKGNVDGTDITVMLPEKYVSSSHEGDYTYRSAIPVDLSSAFDERPTEEQLRNRAKAYLRNNETWVPETNIKVSFVALWQTEDYKHVASLQRVNLCDTVTVIYDALGVRHTLKVIKTKYNVLLDRYDSIELGDAKTTLSQSIISQADISLPPDIVLESSMDHAIKHATKMIKGGLGGFVVTKDNANGLPEEVLILDKPDLEEAVNVIRLNKNGIGFSNTGYDGDYRTAWTIDSHFVADFITTGTFDAGLIKTGLIKAKQGDSYWNMDTGEVYLTSSVRLGSTDVETMQSAIAANANGISAEIRRAKGAEETLTASLKVTTDGLSSEITRAKSAEGTLSSRITQTATEVSSKVSAADVESIISQSADAIRLKASKISWSSTYSSMDTDGVLRCSRVSMTGNLLCGSKAYNQKWLEMGGEGEMTGGFGGTTTGTMQLNGYLSGFGSGIHLNSNSLILGVTSIGVTEHQNSSTVSEGITKEIKVYTQDSNGNGSWSRLKFVNGICVGG